MLTPQDLQEVSFEKAKIGGYVLKSVDDFLEPLMDDYLTLYKENAVLKSKMRLLVERLEEYRAGEATMKAALQEAQKTCDEMIAQAEKKSAELVRQAESTAQNKSRDLDSAVEAEQERLGKARSATAEYIAAVEAQIQKQQRTLDALKSIGVDDAESYFKGKVAEVNKTLVSFKQVGHVKIRTTEFSKNSSKKITRFTIDKTID